ncbi:MAG: D-alanine--poly(phosphoribitol) ligase subunit 2 [Oscillospiraceae bacterium]
MTDVTKILYEICEDENVKNPDYDLIDSGLLDSYAMIELFSDLEDYGIELYPTQIDRERLRTPRSIQELVNEAESK